MKINRKAVKGTTGRFGGQQRRILIVGCGDVGRRILPLLQPTLQDGIRSPTRIFAVTSQAARSDELREAGATPIVANLDQPASLARLAGLAEWVIYLAPPAATGLADQRSRHLAAVLTRTARLVYISTSGVYGNCRGELVSETRPLNPVNDRAVRRADAEQVWRDWARRTASTLSIVRVPGIYAGDRLPAERLAKGLPALLPEQDVYTNHIHADDLARLIVLALRLGRPNRIYHAVDDSQLHMGDYFDLVADHLGAAHPVRLPREQLNTLLTPAMLSFLDESRRLTNLRSKSELGFRLQYPTVQAALSSFGGPPAATSRSDA